MARPLVKLGNYLVEWSTITDSPITFGLTEREMRNYLRDQYGLSEVERNEERLKRAIDRGTSAYPMDRDAADTVKINRAGPNEASMTFEQLVAWAKESRKRGRQ